MIIECATGDETCAPSQPTDVTYAGYLGEKQNMKPFIYFFGALMESFTQVL